MNHWLTELRNNLARLDAENLLRTLRVTESTGRTIRREGRELINLASNDYLGLSTHPRLRDAAIETVSLWGVGAGSSRLVGGHLPIHAEVEKRFAAFKHAEAALLLPTGFTANLAAVTALARPGDLICVDKLNHASLLDAARASGATVRVFPHLGYEKLERLLKRAAATPLPHPPSTIRHPPFFPRSLILTDSIFSMDGDAADLAVLCDLADRYDAILIVDEAHGTGVLGETGAGLCEAQGVAERVDVVISTASKALGGLGGIITARHEIIETIVNRARSFLYTTAIPPAQAAVIGAALDVVRDEPQRRQRLLKLTIDLRQRLEQLGWLPRGQAELKVLTPIIPLVVGEPAEALALSAHLETAGFFAPAIRPPTVAPGASRVRLSLRADLEDGDIERLCAALPALQA